MTFWQFDAPEPGQSYDYPALGLTAVDGAILDGDASTPKITKAPGPEWSVVASGPESGITRQAEPSYDPDYVEPSDGSLLVYSDQANSHVNMSPADFIQGPAAGSLNSAYAKKAEVVVKADGSGDYATLQAAISAVTEGTIRVEDGTHTITGSARMNPAAGVRVVGNGYSTVVRLANGVNGAVFQIDNPNVSIEDLQLDGNKANQTSRSSNGIQFYTGADGGSVRNCWVHDVAGYGIVAWDNVSNVTIEGNRSYNHEEEGIELHGATHSAIVGNLVWGVQQNGIFLWNAGGDCGHCTVSGNVVISPAGGGISVQNGAHDLAITGNTVYGAGSTGIGVSAGTGGVLPHSITVTSNTVEASTGDGFLADSISRLTVTANIIRGNTGCGINISNSGSTVPTPNVGLVIADNVIQGNGTWGILAELDKSAIAGNTISLNKNEGIRIANSDFNTVTGNVVYNNSQAGAGSFDGIRIGGGGTNSTYNTVTGNVSRDDQLLSIPTLTKGATASTGGTFTAGTYYWKVTALSSSGETLGSNEVSATLVANGTQALSWATVPRATSYNVYRGTAAGAESVKVVNQAGTTYTDTGGAGTAGSVPATNTATSPTQRLGINEDSATSGPNIVTSNVAKGNASGQITTRHASSVNANNLVA